MLRQMISVSLLIVVVLLVRTVFRNQVPKRLLYALWIVVLVKLLLPGTLLSLPVLPAQSQAAPTQTATAARTETPVTQQPTSTQPTPQQPLPQLAAAARANAAAWNPTLVSDCLGRRQRRTDCLDGTDLGQLQSAAAADAAEDGPMGKRQYLCFDRGESAVPGGISPGGLPDRGRRPVQRDRADRAA